jgi:tetratricopeptide (TPR) repeat protein
MNQTLALVVLACLPGLSVPPAATDDVATEINPTLEQRMLADAADGRLERFTPLEAALIAGGVRHEAELAKACRQVERFVARIPAQAPGGGGNLELAEAAHRVLRGDVLTGPYRDDAADVAQALGGGEHNCLTATILYNEACRRLGLSAQAVLIPGHVFTRIEGNPAFDVQITCGDWFTRLRARPAEPTGNAAAGSARSADERMLDDVQLIARIYYNHGVRSHYSGDCERSVACLQTAVLLDPEDSAAGRNLLAVLNNWALARCGAGEFSAAAALLEDVRRLDPDYAAVGENDAYICGRWADFLCSQSRYDQALAVLEQGRRRNPQHSFFRPAIEAVDQARQSASP